MKEQQGLVALLRRLWRHISARRRRQFSLLFVLMVAASFAEVVSIGAVLPFLGVLTAPERVFEHAAIQPLIRLLDISEPGQLLLPLTLAFGLAAIVAGTMRLLLLWSNTRLSFATGADLGISIYRRTLYQPYAVHVSRNSSEIITGISSKANTVVFNIIAPILTLLSATIMLSTIMLALLSVEPEICLIVFGGFGLIYGVIIKATRKRQLLNGQRIADESTNVIKALQEGLGGIRDILIDGSQDTYCRSFRNADFPLRRALGNNLFISQSPRFVMEALGMLLIAILAYALAQRPDGLVQAIPVLGALALGAQRLLPVLQQAYVAWSHMRGGQASLKDTLELLDQPLPDDVDAPPPEPLPFRERIRIADVSFRYGSQTPWVLNKLSLDIPRGSRIGFIGMTGGGKSTLLDMIMGLLEPSQGTIEIDGQPLTRENQRSWQAHVAHVPQAIFLSDSSIAENIAFGIAPENIDRERVVQAAAQAKIAETIESWPEGYDTLVGERGVRLSGGQRQRIGIARALYKQADVIVFDEATSALDSETEQAVMQSIDALSDDLTILIIAHRLSTLQNCTQIVELEGGGIKRTGTYKDIVHHADTRAAHIN